MYHYHCTIVRIVDGDTVDVDIDLGFDIILRKQRIRLFRVDTPEKRTRNLREKHFGKLASRIVEELLPIGEICEIETVLDNRGKYGRLLGTITNSDGVDVNQYLINHRYAVEYTGQRKSEMLPLHEANWDWLEDHGLAG